MITRAIKIIGCAAFGTLAAALAGYLIGAAAGLGMTWHNNHRLIDSPQGSYLFWANFTGLIIAMFTWPIGILIGLIVGLSRKDRTAAEQSGKD